MGVNGEVFFQTALVQTSVQTFGPGAESFLQAAETRFRAAGVFNIDSFNNEGFVSIVSDATSLADAIGAINGLSIGQIRLVSVTSTFTLFRSSFSGSRFGNISLVSFFVYKSTTIRAVTLPPPRDN